MDYLWEAIIILTVIMALINITVNILVLTRKKMAFNCEIFVTEYAISSFVFSVLLRQLLSDADVLKLLIVLIIIWISIVASFRVRKIKVIRIYGVKKIMHSKMKELLGGIAAEHNLRRTNVYIYGGDAKTPCNSVILRHVDNESSKAILQSINKFLTTYAANVYSQCATSILFNIAAVFIIVKVLTNNLI